MHFWVNLSAAQKPFVFARAAILGHVLFVVGQVPEFVGPVPNEKVEPLVQKLLRIQDSDDSKAEKRTVLSTSLGRAGRTPTKLASLR